MNIIICGAGKVGFSISKQLSAQGHSVTVIDQSSEDIKKINKVINDILNSSSKFEDDKNILQQSFQSPLKEAREHFEKEYLTNQLKKHHGNISKTADFIGMERSALHRKLKSLGIKGIN